MVFYYQSLRLLLYPQVSRPQVNPRYLKQCAEACGGVCRTFKSLDQNMSVGYSLMALQSVFMAGAFLTGDESIYITDSFPGLTLIYCTWVNPTLIFNNTTTSDISACTVVLFVIS